MTSNKIKVGPITMALGLIASGVILLIGNFVDSQVLLDVWKFWPLILIGLGLEFLIKDILRKRSPEPKDITFSWASLIIVSLVLIVGFSANMAYKIAGSTNVDYMIKEALFGNAVQTTRSFELPPVDLAGGEQKFILENRRGDIRLQASNDAQLHIKGQVLAGGPNLGDAKARASKVKTEVTQGQNVMVKTVLPDYFGPQDNLRVNYTIAVPKGVKVEINNGVGEIIVRDLGSSVQIANQVGAVRVNNVQGDLTVQNDTGKIDVEKIQGTTRLDTKTGEIEISEPGGDVAANTRVGHIKFDSSQALAKDYHLSTDTGSIDLRISKKSNLKLDGVTERGSVNGPSAYISQENSRQLLKGMLGNGQGSLRVQSKIGSISLDVD